jgi:type III pantothenate kinase
MISNYVVSIDIGNTNTHLGLVDVNKILCKFSKTFPTKRIIEKVDFFLKEIKKYYKGINIKNNTQISICSVVKINKRNLEKKIVNCGFEQPFWLEFNKKIPIKIKYKTTKTLGADRIANCLYGNYFFPGKNQILIDAGTAITIDFLQNGNKFIGGVILPGPVLQLKSLYEKTSLLPFISPPDKCIKFIGNSTKSCILSGVFYGIAGAINSFISQYINYFGDSIILSTGGSWKFLEKKVKFRYKYVKDMSVIGTALYLKYLKKTD